MRTCDVEGCIAKHFGHGMCEIHYKRFRRYGTTDLLPRQYARPRRPPRRTPGVPLGRPRQSVADVERFILSIPPDANGCMIWPHHVSHNGYGRVTIGRHTFRAHRIALAMKLGRPIAEGMFACHSCDVPPCVNPEHLWEGTHAENMADWSSKGAPSRAPHSTNKQPKKAPIK